MHERTQDLLFLLSFAPMAVGCPAVDLQSRITLPMTAGQTVIVVVDGYTMGDAGPFLLNISQAP